MSKTVSLRQCFAHLHDPRREHGREHNLWDIVALTICAVVAGADGWVDVEEYGLAKLAWLKTFLELPNGIPAHDTIGRVFSILNPVAFQQCFSQWVQCLVEATEGRVVAIDGKTARRSSDKANGKEALHLVSAWATKNHLTLGQVAVDGKSNEITAIPELLRIIDITKAIVTIDAMGCQKDIAEAIDQGGGNYVLGLKKNQPTLYADVDQVFCDGLENEFADRECHEFKTHDENHGRIEDRIYRIMPVPKELAQKHPEWRAWRSIGMVYSVRKVGDQENAEVRYFVSSLKPQVKTFARAVRSHWGIENSLHWVLDIAFREDESRVRKDHAQENLALLRKLSAALLKKENSSKVGIACKRKQAGWDNEYLERVLGRNLW